MFNNESPADTEGTRIIPNSSADILVLDYFLFSISHLICMLGDYTPCLGKWHESLVDVTFDSVGMMESYCKPVATPHGHR